jgi:hypothetical protein
MIKNVKKKFYTKIKKIKILNKQRLQRFPKEKRVARDLFGYAFSCHANCVLYIYIYNIKKIIIYTWHRCLRSRVCEWGFEFM